jgi:hypothetical protein
VGRLNDVIGAGDLFEELSGEDEQVLDRSAYLGSSEQNPRLEKIIESYNRFGDITEALDIGASKVNEDDEDPFYTLAKVLIPKRYTSKDVTEFSIRQSQRFGSIDGYYLSALINKGIEAKYLVFLDQPIGYIGWENNGKIITVIGDVDEFLGVGMTDGRILLRGNAGDYAGEVMKGGKLIIDGNAGDNLGRGMSAGEIEANNVRNRVGSDISGGKITVKGDAGHSVGEYRPDIFHEETVENGIIYLGGNYKSLAEHIKCKEIYHKGKLIVKDGRLI